MIKQGDSMKEFKINQEVLGIIIRYLAQKPWGEVNKLLVTLGQLEEIKPTPKKK